MAAIPTNIGEGGKGLGRGNGPITLAAIFTDLITDLATLKGSDPTATAAASAVSASDGAAVAGSAVSAFAVADIAAFTDPPSAAEMALLRTFVNSLKTNVNSLNTRVEATVTAANVLVTLANDLKTAYGTARTLVNLLRTGQITRGSATLLTTQGS